MKALSIQQPWAWAILHAGKDIENRTWPTKVRGRILIHAGLKHAGGDAACDILDIMEETGMSDGKIDRLIKAQKLGFGGLIGSVEIVDCVQSSTSPWFFGPHGFILRDPRPFEIIPFKGKLGFFDVPDDILKEIKG